MLAVTRAADLTAGCATVPGCGTVVSWDEEIAPLLGVEASSGPLHRCVGVVWPRSRFMWRCSWLCLCGPVTWDEAFVPDAATVSPADHGTVI